MLNNKIRQNLHRNSFIGDVFRICQLLCLVLFLAATCNAAQCNHKCISLLTHTLHFFVTSICIDIEHNKKNRIQFGNFFRFFGNARLPHHPRILGKKSFWFSESGSLTDNFFYTLLVLYSFIKN